MDTDEKIAESEKLKARGTDFFQVQQYQHPHCKLTNNLQFCFLQKGKNKLAASKYKRITEILQYENTLEGEQKQKRDTLYRAAHLNLALVLLKGAESAEAIKHCESVLEEDKSNVKALYRRADVRLRIFYM